MTARPRAARAGAAKPPRHAPRHVTRWPWDAFRGDRMKAEAGERSGSEHRLGLVAGLGGKETANRPGPSGIRGLRQPAGQSIENHSVAACAARSIAMADRISGEAPKRFLIEGVRFPTMCNQEASTGRTRGGYRTAPAPHARQREYSGLVVPTQNIPARQSLAFWRANGHDRLMGTPTCPKSSQRAPERTQRLGFWMPDPPATIDGL